MLNIHHLELFYYVARHGGISRAVRQMPYGIQQPAISSQLLQLEDGLGTKLFDRQPFRLTLEGEQLYAYVGPFFEGMEKIETQLSRKSAPQLRIGASQLISRDHLPAVIHAVRKKHPEHRFFMRTGVQAQLETWLRERQLDMAFVTALQPASMTGLRKLALLRMPLVLLVPRKSPFKSAAELWALDRIDEPLISLATSGSVFQKGLQRLKVDWHPSIEANSLELVTWYVANDYGIGVQVNVPEVVNHPKVRALPLVGFDPVEIVALWQGKPTLLIREVVEEAQAYIRQVWPQLACNEKLK